MKSIKNKNTDNKRSEKVGRRNDTKNSEQEFPGYPSYPPEEDIMNKSTKVVRIEGDIENTNSSGRGINMSKEQVEGIRTFSEDEMAEGVETEFKGVPAGIEEAGTDLAGTQKDESDVTEEDMEALGPKDLSMDMGEDEQLLKHRPWPVDFAGDDLDVPNDDSARSDALEMGDEENDHYSLGGDRHEDLEEGKS